MVKEGRDHADAILDMLEYAARDHLLWSCALIVLVQTDDPAYECEPIGGRRANWNGREWFATDRDS